MPIKLHGIIQYWNNDHKYVDVVVTEEHPDIYVTHRVGVDIPVNRGTIEAALARLAGGKPDQVVWPHHIEAVDIKRSSENDKDIKVGRA